MKNLFFILIFYCLVFLSETAFADTNQDWKSLLKEGRNAISDKDSSYAFYKLRKAWLAVPDKNLESSSYKKIRSSLADAFDLAENSNESKTLKESSYTMAQLDKRIKNRETYGKDEKAYSVELKLGGNLAFTLKNLDKPYTPEGICVSALRNMSSEERTKWNKEAPQREKNDKEWYQRRQAKIRAQMPIIYSPEDPKYEELLSLCQPIEPGDKKENTGFDFNPFAPKELKTLADL